MRPRNRNVEERARWLELLLGPGARRSITFTRARRRERDHVDAPLAIHEHARRRKSSWRSGASAGCLSCGGRSSNCSRADVIWRKGEIATPKSDRAIRRIPVRTDGSRNGRRPDP